MNALKDRAEAYLLEDLYEEGTLVCILYILQLVFQSFFNMRFGSALLFISNQHSCRFRKISAVNFVLISTNHMHLIYLELSFYSGLCLGSFMRAYSLFRLKHLFISTALLGKCII